MNVKVKPEYIDHPIIIHDGNINHCLSVKDAERIKEELDVAIELIREAPRDKFIQSMVNIVRQFENRNKLFRIGVKNAIFCVLTVLDGQAGNSGLYSLRSTDYSSVDGPDIAGGLHGAFMEALKKLCKHSAS